ncbi:hypothetical protein O9Z70_13280 [Devosia sp. YIM 151766]|uniref:hypothetical protein n=1 Tax=Devosia sp. YIM 151766 TaxID=3017325 RepID=UPI00255C532C|nr:hypothetical protein [Devosia sp. YIM 151766]WIY52422.1 hypothetical protein O9Z70_13280 [Devosia sp. YIM 151766]
MRIILQLLVLVTTLTFSGAAFANCGPAFYGYWRNDIGPISGQYARMNFMAQSYYVFLDTLTATSSDFGSRATIYEASYMEPQHLSATATGTNTCVIKFVGKPSILKDTYNAYRDYAQTANLTVNGSNLRWCWSRAGHHGGDCVNFRLLRKGVEDWGTVSRME